MNPRDAIQRADRELNHAERLMSLAKTARALDVCPRTVRRWIDSGRLAAVRYPSGRWRVSSIVIAQIKLVKDGHSMT